MTPGPGTAVVLSADTRTSTKFARLMFEDAYQSALQAEEMGATGWRVDGTIAPFLAKWFPEFETFLSTERDMDRIVSVIDMAWNEVLPTTYVIARDGEVAFRMQGGSSAEEFAEAIRPLL